MLAEGEDSEICQELDKNRLKVIHAVTFVISRLWAGKPLKWTTVYQPRGMSFSHWK